MQKGGSFRPFGLMTIGSFRLAQAGSVIGNCLDLRIGHLDRDHAHHLGRIVRALAGTEKFELSFDIFGKLARKTRVLDGQARFPAGP